ncbi:WbqC family protein [Empedobacter sedimenti]|uniref:WbqC family protein n=1 Tax=Empedobacter sedimenti TaxID=3042610 RepID=UPI0024A61107|nr:WbqC family protein [Empedobacter sedimenti]
MKNTFAAFYFGPIDYYAEMVKSQSLNIEVCENFQKQTYRNRMNILGANGKLMLNIPIFHNGTRLFKDLQPSYEYDWQKEHIKSLKSAYQSSPYFEYYEDDIIPILEQKEKFLLDFNLKTIDFINNKLKLDLDIQQTESYQSIDQEFDFRNQFSAKKPAQYELTEYAQVFDDKFEFIPDLSILDLLFSEGPSAVVYLKNLIK